MHATPRARPARNLRDAADSQGNADIDVTDFLEDPEDGNPNGVHFVGAQEEAVSAQPQIDIYDDDNNDDPNAGPVQPKTKSQVVGWQGRAQSGSQAMQAAKVQQPPAQAKPGSRNGFGAAQNGKVRKRFVSPQREAYDEEDEEQLAASYDAPRKAVAKPVQQRARSGRVSGQKAKGMTGDFRVAEPLLAEEEDDEGETDGAPFMPQQTRPRQAQVPQVVPQGADEPFGASRARTSGERGNEETATFVRKQSKVLKTCVMSADFWGLKTAGGTATAYHLLASTLAKSHALQARTTNTGLLQSLGRALKQWPHA